jgi:hypothetical protein
LARSITIAWTNFRRGDEPGRWREPFLLSLSAKRSLDPNECLLAQTDIAPAGRVLTFRGTVPVSTLKAGFYPQNIAAGLIAATHDDGVFVSVISRLGRSRSVAAGSVRRILFLGRPRIV